MNEAVPVACHPLLAPLSSGLGNISMAFAWPSNLAPSAVAPGAIPFRSNFGACCKEKVLSQT